MRRLILSLMVLMVFLTFLASPAPVSLGAMDLTLIALPLLIGGLCLGNAARYDLFSDQYLLTCITLLYLSSFIIAGLLGIAQGAPAFNILRSIGPYLDFAPLLFLIFLPKNYLTLPFISGVLILVGILQISYLSYLYFTHNAMSHSAQGVLVNRITLLDPRTTLPYLLTVPILPLTLSSINTRYRFLLSVLIISLISFGLFAGMITLTRAIFLSIAFSWLVFIILYCYYNTTLGLMSPGRIFLKLSGYVLLLLTLFALISLIPKVHYMEMGLLERFSPGAKHHTDYSNGRLYDEWIPALMTWTQSDFIGWLFGIGAGHALILPNGEERTYIHNLSIYSLVYGGFYGFFAYIALYCVLFGVLIKRAVRCRELNYIIFASLLAGMFFYGQLFAVHKVMAFNMMLFLLLVIGLKRYP